MCPGNIGWGIHIDEGGKGSVKQQFFTCGVAQYVWGRGANYRRSNGGGECGSWGIL